MLTNKQQKINIHIIVLWKNLSINTTKEVATALTWHKPTCAHDSSGVLALTE